MPPQADNAAMLRRWWCARRGHRWDLPSDFCLRCKRTGSEIALGPRTVEEIEHENESYWRGVEDGRKVDRKRAYRLGYMRGGRDVFGKVEEVFGDVR